MSGADGLAQGADACDILGDGQPSDLGLHPLEACGHIAPRLVEQAVGELAFGIVEASGIDGDFVADLAAEEGADWEAGGFAREIPESDVERGKGAAG